MSTGNGNESAVGETGSTPIDSECPSGVVQTTRRSGTPARALAVGVLTALGERDGAIGDTELRVGGALLAMTDGEATGCAAWRTTNRVVL
jgi:hypothetical protein